MLLSKHTVSHTRVSVEKETYSHKDNRALVSQKEHDAWLTLFGNGTLTHIINTLNSKWIDQRFEVVVVRKQLMNLQRLTKGRQ